MKIISHRGNLSGPNPARENEPRYIDEAIECGFDVEVDIWWVDGKWWLGHDKPQYEIVPEWIVERYDPLWLHCKNLDALKRLVGENGLGGYLNYFWHEHDSFTLTSWGYIWTYPGKSISEYSILVDLEGKATHDGAMGVCTDYPLNIA